MSNRNGDLAAALSQILARHKNPAASSKAEDVIGSLAGARELVEKYVTGVERVNWFEELALAGLKAESRNGATILSVALRVNDRQHAILKRLGYN